MRRRRIRHAYIAWSKNPTRITARILKLRMEA